MGSLTVGKKADLVLYDLKSLSLLPRTDPVGLLVLGRPTQAVHSVWVNGKQIVDNCQVATINVDDLRQQLFERSHWHQRRSQTVGQIESHYRAVLGLPEQALGYS